MKEEDCLRRALVPVTGIRTDVCIATVVSAGYAPWLNDWLGSLRQRGECEDALIVVFVVDGAEDCLQAIARHSKNRMVVAVPIEATVPVTPAIKGVIYSVARWVEAKHYICLEADMLVLRSLQPLIEATRICRDWILTVKCQGLPATLDLEDWFTKDVRGTREELQAMLGAEYAPQIRHSNGGLICGGRSVMLKLDEQIRRMMPSAGEWIDARRSMPWRDEWVFNLAMHALGCNLPIGNEWNAQLHVEKFARQVTATGNGEKFQVWMSDGNAVSVLHIVGSAKARFGSWRGHFS